MPNAVIKSFADKSGKSVAEVEKIYQEIKASAKDPENYKYIIGTLKKILKITSLKESFSDMHNTILETELFKRELSRIENANK